MKSFITQFRKAKLNKMRLIWDGQECRYLVTDKKHWQDWSGCRLIIKFN